ncbi:MAG: glycosyltransferase [Chitinophagales bacterium]|nr:glycosyltransferase [Chitinophagales bacterium]
MEQQSIILLSTSDILYDQRLIKIATALQSFGANVSLIGRKLSDNRQNNSKKYTEKRIACVFNKGVLFYAEINLRFFFLLLFSKYNKVCANDADTLFGAWLASFFKKFELYYDAHEIFTEVPELEGKFIKKRIWAWVEKKGMRKAKKLYTVNESVAVFLQEKYGRKFDVIMNVPELKYQKETNENQSFILYQGALNKGRGLKELIKAMGKIDMPLKIAGSGDIENELKILVADLNLTDKVTFFGKLLPKDLEQITQKAYLGVNLLDKSSMNYYYSLANKFFDYAHAGIPQIGMNFPEYERINKEFEVSLLINTLSVKEIEETINKLIKNKELYNNLKNNTLALSKNYNWDKEKEKLKLIYLSQL